MKPRRQRSAWFYVGVVCLSLAWGPFFLGFLGVITWGWIFVPLPVLVCGVPYMLVHFFLWGRKLTAQYEARRADGLDCGR